MLLVKFNLLSKDMEAKHCIVDARQSGVTEKFKSVPHSARGLKNFILRLPIQL